MSAADEAYARAVASMGAAEGDELFRLWSTRELLDAPRAFTWRIRGMLSASTYGPIGGERKALKSYVASFIAVGAASGEPVFDRFTVDEPMPVVAYVGEGGRIPYTRRLERIAAAMGVKLADVPLLTTFEVAPIGSERFSRSLDRDLEQHRPGLVVVDPLYAYHPPTTNASNLYERGAMLSSVSAPCVDAGASALIVDHWNKTGTGRGLERIAQVGVQEWADTWLLLSHREPPEVEAGDFHLSLEIGSRQWGGSSWELELSIGRFDPDLGEYDGDISWELRRAAGASSRDAATEDAILMLLGDHPFELTESAIVDRVGGNKARTRTTLKRLIEERRIVAIETPRHEGGRSVSRRLLGMADFPAPGKVAQ